VQSGGDIKNVDASADAWGIVTSPNPGSNNNYLYGVSLADSNNVWAVGSYTSGIYRTLAVIWNGTSWNLVSTPNPYVGDNELYGVDARTSSDVWAVGNVSGPGTPQPIILHRGSGLSGWVSATVPFTSGHSIYLRGVSAVSSNLAWAVGFDGYSPIIYKWNGTTWSYDATMPSGLTAQLRAVSAVSSTEAWAVGSTGPGNTGDTFTLHWNGSNWSHISSPHPGTVNNGLSGVKAVSTSLVYAVGYADSGSGAQTLALKWDGSSWTRETSDNPNTTDQLEAVDVGGTQTWAVGESRTGGFRTLTERRDPATGTWNAVTSPNNNSNTHFLHGVAVDPDITGCTGGDIWAVGNYIASSGFQTLIMQYTVTSPCSP
jgi:hypothetical protein